MPLSTTGLDATWSDIVWGYVGVLAMLLSAGDCAKSAKTVAAERVA